MQAAVPPFCEFGPLNIVPVAAVIIDDLGHSSGPTLTKSELEPPLVDPFFGLWWDVFDLWLPAEAAVDGTMATERPKSSTPLPTNAACLITSRSLPCLMFRRMTSQSESGHPQANPEIVFRFEPTGM